MIVSHNCLSFYLVGYWLIFFESKSLVQLFLLFEQITEQANIQSSEMILAHDNPIPDSKRQRFRSCDAEQLLLERDVERFNYTKSLGIHVVSH